MLQKLTNNSLLRYFYRLLKIVYYNLLYKTNIYKRKYSTDITSVLDSEKKYKLVVCHNGGGGTVSYMKNKYAASTDVIFLRNTVSADIDYLYNLENSENKKQVFIKPEELPKLSQNIYEIHIIAVESYMSLSFILNWFASLKVPVTYDLHDYHCVWYETHFIHNGEYLTKEKLEMSLLHYGKTKISFQEWHDIWNNFFPCVKTINAFSESSKQIFKEYYPNYADKVIVTPHSLDYISCKKLNSIPEKFCIGIFGLIKGADKGCNIIHSFLKYSKNKDYQIFLNGDLNSDCKVYASNIHYMGRYEVSRLDQIILEQGISCVLFPSICPETFSYTVSELIHVGIPIACFNLGAQAEKVSQYKYGELIKENNNDAIYDALLKAHRKGQRRNSNE